MSTAKIYETAIGWVFEIWFQGRIVIVGCRSTREAAQRAAAMA